MEITFFNIANIERLFWIDGILLDKRNEKAAFGGFFISSFFWGAVSAQIKGLFAVCWQLQLFCKVGFCVLALCALQMCCNVRWAVRDFELNVLEV